MKLWVRIESLEKSVDIEERNGSYTVNIDGIKRVVDCRYFGHKDYLSLLIDNKSYLVESAPLKAEEGKFYAQVAGHRYDIDVLDERLVAVRQVKAVAKKSGNYVVTSPMPGLVVDVKVRVGDRVEAGSAVVIMEAMKMQNELICEVDGTVKAVWIRPKDTVDSRSPLIEIERS